MSTPTNSILRGCDRCGQQQLPCDYRFCHSCGAGLTSPQEELAEAFRGGRHAPLPTLEEQQPRPQQEDRKQQDTQKFPAAGHHHHHQQDAGQTQGDPITVGATDPAGVATATATATAGSGPVEVREWRSADGTVLRRVGPHTREWTYTSPDGQTYEHAVQEWGPDHQIAAYKATRRWSTEGVAPIAGGGTWEACQRELRQHLDRQLDTLRHSLRMNVARWNVPDEPGRWAAVDRGIEGLRVALDEALLAEPLTSERLNRLHQETERFQREMWAEIRSCYPSMPGLHDDVWRDMDVHLALIRNSLQLPTMEWDRPLLAQHNDRNIQAPQILFFTTNSSPPTANPS